MSGELKTSGATLRKKQSNKGSTAIERQLATPKKTIGIFVVFLFSPSVGFFVESFFFLPSRTVGVTHNSDVYPNAYGKNRRVYDPNFGSYFLSQSKVGPTVSIL